MYNPFKFLGRPLGDGDVIGLTSVESLTVRWFMVVGSPPKLVLVNGLRGIKFELLTGESGEDDGDGSDNEDVSVVKVVVGDDSADSKFCVDVLSLCLCEGSVGN